MIKIVIDRGRLNEGKPAVVVIADDRIRYVNEVEICGPCTITGVASGKEPLGGAKVWIETNAEIRVKGE